MCSLFLSFFLSFLQTGYDDAFGAVSSAVAEAVLLIVGALLLLVVVAIAAYGSGHDEFCIFFNTGEGVLSKNVWESAL